MRVRARPPRGLACWSALALSSSCLLALGCQSPAPLPPETELTRALTAAAKRLLELRGESGRLKQLPRIERWERSRLQRELDARWARDWPQAEREGDLLRALDLWPSGLDYRAEILGAVVADTDALYLEDEHKIVVLAEPLSAGTLVHELVHALQRERWGPLAPPATIAQAFARSAQLEGEAILSATLSEAPRAARRGPASSAPSSGGSDLAAVVEGLRRRAEESLAAGLERGSARPAWRWLWVEPSLEGAAWAADAYARRGWRAFADPPPPQEAGAPGAEALGPRGWEWLRERWGVWRLLPEGEWLVSDRLELEAGVLRWNLVCRDPAAARSVADALRGARDPQEVRVEGAEIEVRRAVPSGE